jgi:uncharacterized protein YndB with AHSA1/START domain
MRAPNGKEVAFKGVFREVVRPERLVYTECYDDPSVGSPEWLTTVTFEERGGKTKLTNTGLHPSEAMRNGRLQSGMEENAGMMYERILELLAKMRG